MNFEDIPFPQFWRAAMDRMEELLNDPRRFGFCAAYLKPGGKFLATGYRPDHPTEWPLPVYHNDNVW